jgi:hypothetical protein
MGKKDPRVDAYIAKAGDFAKPILTRLRAAVHAACPDVKEAMLKHRGFVYGGMLAIASFRRQHSLRKFWKARRSSSAPVQRRTPRAMG